MMYLDFHTHSDSLLPGVVSIVNSFPFSKENSSFFSVGIHPWYINKSTLAQEIEILKNKAAHNNCISIGECGIDRFSKVSINLQMEVFERHIVLSEHLKKTLTIHCVKAFSEILMLRKRYNPSQKWVIHGFRKPNKSLAFKLIDKGICLSFGKALLYDKELQNLFSQLPSNTFYLETDTPLKTNFQRVSIIEIYNKAHSLQSFTNEQIIRSLF